MTKKQIADMTERELAALTDEEFLCVARGQDPAASSKVDLSTGKSPEHEVAEIEAALLQRSGATLANFSTNTADEATDLDMLRGLQDSRNGSADARRTQRAAYRAQAEELWYWLREHRAGHVIGSDLEDTLRELAFIR